MEFRAIGTIHSPFERVEDMPIQSAGAADVVGTVIMDPELTDGLRDLDGFSHIILIYTWHRSQGFSLLVKPFLDTVEHGVFATRAPRRPNPIGLSVVRLLGIEGNVLHVQGMDVLNGTPLLDIKPYIPAVDAVAAERIGWVEGRSSGFKSGRSDGRFAD